MSNGTVKYKTLLENIEIENIYIYPMAEQLTKIHIKKITYAKITTK